MKKILVFLNNKDSGKYLQRCIDSIKNQTFTNYDVFGLDCHSKDNSVEIFERNNITVIPTTGNQAVSLNQALNSLKDNWDDYLGLKWINPDDQYYRKSFEIAYNNMIKDPINIGLVYTYCKGKYESFGQFIDMKYKNNIKKEIMEGRNPILHPTTFINMEVFKKIGLFDESLDYPIDMELWYRIFFNHFKLVGIPEFTAELAIRGDNLTNTRGPEIRKEIDIINKMYKVGKYRE